MALRSFSRLLPYGIVTLLVAFGLALGRLWVQVSPDAIEVATLSLLACSLAGALLGGIGPGLFATVLCWLLGSAILGGDADIFAAVVSSPATTLFLPLGVAMTLFVAAAARYGTLLGDRESGALVDSVRKLRASRDTALAASRAKSEYLASMTHEIRTPLAAILGFSELLLEPEQSPAERIHYVKIIRRNGELLSQIIGNVLDLSKIEAGRMELESIPVNVRQLVGDVVESLGHRAQSKDLRLELDVREIGPSLEVATDPTRLKQILVNIIGNAVKFTDKGSVSVVARLGGDHTQRVLEIVVKDTGIGFTPEQREHLFESYAQAESSTTRKYGGTGLGLNLARHLARLLDGDLELLESLPGQGSTFRLRVNVGLVAIEPEPRRAPLRVGEGVGVHGST